MHFQMADLVEVPTKIPIEDSAESVLEGMHTISTTQNNIYSEAAENNKEVQD